MKQNKKQFISLLLSVVLVITMLPVNAFAANFDESVSGNYYNILSKKEYDLVPGATESEIILNNADGTRRQVLHVFEVDTQNPAVSVVPGYNMVDKFAENPNDVNNQSAAKVTDMAAYYEKNLGYNVVGAMNIALAYDCNAPYTYLMYDGVVLQDKNLSYQKVENAEWKLADSFYNEDGSVNDKALNQHSGSCATYLAIKKDGTCELRSGSEPYEADDWNAIGANFNWCVKDGKNVASEERTSDPASRSMVGIKEDGTLVMCMADGRGANNAVGLSNYELGEMMLSLGCKWAFNGDGGGSSTFISQREGEEDLTMRSVPSDGAERPTIHAIMLVSNLNPTGVFDKAVITSEYDYFAPSTTYTFEATGLDTGAFSMEIPKEATWSLSDPTFGEISNGTFVSNGTLGEVDIQMEYNGAVVGSYTINVVNPKSISLVNDSTVIPYGKSVDIDIEAVYGKDNVPVFFDASTFDVVADKPDDCVIEGLKVTSPKDETKTGVVLTISYKYDDSFENLILTVNYGKGSEIIWDFEDGEKSGFVAFDEAKAWSVENGLNNTLVGSDPLAGQWSEQVDGDTYVATSNDGQVHGGKHSLAWVVDNSEAGFNGWTYNVLFNIDDVVVFRDVANGKNATTLGMWLYVPEGATGLAFQSQLNSYANHAVDGKASCVQDHFMLTTVSGAKKSLNNCTEADIPESRWVYASIDISKYDYLSTMPSTNVTNSRTPSFIRTYIKPPVPAVHTFYIDDITLDYSAAVDDRDAPIISNPAYAPNDESISFDTVATVNTMTFSATIEDVKAQNTSGLAYETAMIYVDGRPVEEVTASGNTMFTKNPVTLSNGEHQITFEIADKLGNTSEITKTLKVEVADGKEALVSIGGHNDGNNVPMYDSIYYADINVADVEQVEEIYARIQLNTANTWEIEGVTTLPGFTVEEIKVLNSSDRENAVTYSIHDMENVLYIHLVKNSECTVSGKQTVASIPVRVWSWDAVDHTDGKDVNITINNQIVNIDYEVLEGYVVTDVENDEGETFYGKQSVATEIQKGVTSYHTEHTTTTLEDKDPTCTAEGYVNRTYCDVCDSIVDWGTKLDKLAHHYELNNENYLVCECGHKLVGNGIVNAGNAHYYLIADKAVSGWQNVEDDIYCYADATTKKLATGKVTIDNRVYTFGENGAMLEGAWVSDNNGTKYYYGPANYVCTGANPHANAVWAKIGDDTYAFDRNGYRHEGIRILVESNAPAKVYEFTDEGVLVGEYVTDHTGIFFCNGMTGYLEDGVPVAAGLVKDGKDYYYINSGYRAVTGSYEVTRTNNLLEPGIYEFDSTGKMLNPPVVKNGVQEDGTLYIDGVLQKAYQLVEFEGNYYFINDGKNRIAKNTTLYLSETFVKGHTFADGTAIQPGSYEFDAEGKMVIKHGIIDDCIYINGVLQKAYQLVEFEGNYYFINDGKNRIAKNNTLYLSETFVEGHAFADGTAIQPGYYEFDAEGKMVIKHGIIDDCIYINGVLQKAYQLVEFEGNHYFINDGKNRIAKNNRLYLSEKFVEGHTFADGTAIQPGYYEFDEDGKMVVLNGPNEDGFFYLNGEKQLAYQLIKYDGNYYFINDGHKYAKNKELYLSEQFVEGTDLEPWYYEFGPDGKMVGYIEGIANGRDLGNIYFLKNTDGQSIKEGMIIRGSELDGWENGKITDEQAAKAIDVLLNTYKVSMEMDFRATTLPELGVKDMLGDGVVHKYYGMVFYEDVFTEEGKEIVKDIFTDLANADNYPIYMHCAQGIDRVGTVVAILESLLGVNKSTICNEYMLSVGAYGNSIVKVIDGMNSYDGATLQEKTESYLLDCGVTQKQIDSIRDILLEK